jgi:site-specific recombinase XerD
VVQIPFAKQPKKLPVVLAPEEVQRFLSCARPLKLRVILTTIYAAGLRLEEATHLEVQHIDSARMLLLVARGKGSKERLVPLSPRLLQELREYWKAVPRWSPRHAARSQCGSKGLPTSSVRGTDCQTCYAAHSAERFDMVLYLSENDLFQR